MTKGKRHSIYIKALGHIESHAEDFICDAIQLSGGFRLNNADYPELENRKPKETIRFYGTEIWFENNDEGRQKRIEILKQAIEETKP